ncbi:MAG: ABC transporter permease [Chloroflexota bacterium]
MNRTLHTLAAQLLPPIVAFALLIALWWAYVEWKGVSIFVAPTPGRVASRFFDDPGYFLRNGGWTLWEATLGLFFGSAIAIALAVAMAHSRVLERAIFPLAIAAKVMPLVAIAPVLVIIFGFGQTPKIIVAALLSFFPMLVAAMTGFRDVDPRALEFFRSIHASAWSVFWKLRVPSSLPHLFNGVRISYPLALIGAVVAEWFTGTRGLGYIVYSSWLGTRTPELFASIVVLVVIGVAINVVLSLVEHRVLFWHESVRSTE